LGSQFKTNLLVGFKKSSTDSKKHKIGFFLWFSNYPPKTIEEFCGHPKKILFCMELASGLAELFPSLPQNFSTRLGFELFVLPFHTIQAKVL